VGAVIATVRAVGGLPQVRRGVGRLRLVGLLRVEAGAAEVAVEDAAPELVADQRPDRRRPHPVLAPLRVVARVQDRAGRDLGLVDR
jgi:hypothetical protein